MAGRPGRGMRATSVRWSSASMMMTAGCVSAGKVGSGFNGATRKAMLARLAPLAVEEAPFDPPPPQNYKGRWGGDLTGVTWVRPEVVDPSRARWLVTRRDGPPDILQGLRGRPGPDDGRPRDSIETAAAIEEAESEAVDGAKPTGAMTLPPTRSTATTACRWRRQPDKRSNQRRGEKQLGLDVGRSPNGNRDEDYDRL